MIVAAWPAALVAAWVQSPLHASAVMFLQRPMTFGGGNWKSCPRSQPDPC